jgi:NAD(P)-dependent dehydrogenase (short-subunit alcohol dehydrogenase family)
VSDFDAAESPVVVVTGAYGSIGRETVSRVSGRNGRVVAVDVARLPDATAKQLIRELIVDLLDDGATERAFASIADLPTPHHVMAIAGGGDAEELGQADPATESLEIFSRVVASNLHIAFVTIRHTVPLLRRSTGDRSITLVSSINAMGGYGAPAYSAAKAGLSGLVNALATPLGSEGIRINCLALGTVDTDNLRHLAELRNVKHDLPAMAARAPLRRVLTPADVAMSLVAIAFDMRGLTGATVVVDNGQTLIR